MRFFQRPFASGTRRYISRPEVEELGARIMPASFVWTGPGGTVSDPVNGTFWDENSWNPPGIMPGSNDTCFIQAATVGMDDPSGETVGSIQLGKNATLNVTAINQVKGFVYQGSSDD